METVQSKLKVFRQGDALTCQRIWDAIKLAKVDRKAPTANTILRYCCKKFNISAEFFQEQLGMLVKDQLIIENVTAPSKGSNKGVEQVIYSIPLESEIDLSGKNDWYCFCCHKPGEVLPCKCCPRVYHLDCLNLSVPPEDEFICPPCKESQKHSIEDVFARKELNNLLSFACARLEEKLPIENYAWNPINHLPHNASFTTDRCAAALLKKIPRQKSNEKEGWRSKFLLKMPTSLPKINDRTDRQVYKSLAQFRTDCATVLHNIAVFHGEHSPLADSARVMQRDCVHELEEIRLCLRCYERSNKQEEKDWFCQPCDPPHELVFAKAKGYPFWPAKVLRVTDDLYDVRFFGTGHDRALLDKNFIRPITSNIQSLVTKRSSGWVKAMEELKAHQVMLLEAEAHSDEEPINSDYEINSKVLEEELSQSPALSDNSRHLRVSVSRLDSVREPERLTTDVIISENLATDVIIPNDAHKSEENLAQPMVSVPKEVINLLSNDTTVSDLDKSHLQTAFEKVSTLEKKIEHLKESYAAEIKSLRDNYEKRIKEETEALKESHTREIEALKEKHQKEIAANKKKQWCIQCGKEGVYHCCINVHYCSANCQQLNWKTVHRKICKRERETKADREKKP